MAQSEISKLELEASGALSEARNIYGMGPESPPLSFKQFTEKLSAFGFFNRYRVMLNRLGGLNEKQIQEQIKWSVAVIGEVANSGFYPSLAEIREILHPPFESFGSAVVALSDTGTNSNSNHLSLATTNDLPPEITPTEAQTNSGITEPLATVTYADFVARVVLDAPPRTEQSEIEQLFLEQPYVEDSLTA